MGSSIFLVLSDNACSADVYYLPSGWVSSRKRKWGDCRPDGFSGLRWSWKWTKVVMIQVREWRAGIGQASRRRAIGRGSGGPVVRRVHGQG